MLQIEEFPPVSCDGPEAEELIHDLLAYAQAKGVGVGFYINRVAVIVKPEKSAEAVADNYFRAFCLQEVERRMKVRRRPQNTKTYDGFEHREHDRRSA